VISIRFLLELPEGRDTPAQLVGYALELGTSGLLPSLLFQRNIHPKFVQELLGHANVYITLDTYSHMLPGMGGEEADAMGEALG
jgi:hypothetical protein